LDLGQNDRIQVRDRVRRLIHSQRELNEQVYRFSQETSDPDIQRTLRELASRGQENIHKLSRLLALKCAT